MLITTLFVVALAATNDTDQQSRSNSSVQPQSNDTPETRNMLQPPPPVNSAFSHAMHAIMVVLF
jgi:hypothetical protein